MAYEHQIQLLAAPFLAIGLLTACRHKDNMADRIVMVQDDDKAMETAGKAALEELPLFWDRFSHPEPGDDTFSVKVAISDPNGIEYFWLADIQRSGNTVSGVVDARPQIVKIIKRNQRIEIGTEKVIDWLFMANGKMKGNFTLRPIMNKIPKEDLEKLLPLLDPTPSIRKDADKKG